MTKIWKQVPDVSCPWKQPRKQIFLKTKYMKQQFQDTIHSDNRDVWKMGENEMSRINAPGYGRESLQVTVQGGMGV